VREGDKQVGANSGCWTPAPPRGELAGTGKGLDTFYKALHIAKLYLAQLTE